MLVMDEELYEDYKDYKDYKAIYIVANSGEQDAKDLDHAIRVYSEDGGLLHSITPRIEDGDTVGYVIVFDLTNVE